MYLVYIQFGYILVLCTQSSLENIYIHIFLSPFCTVLHILLRVCTSMHCKENPLRLKFAGYILAERSSVRSPCRHLLHAKEVPAGGSIPAARATPACSYLHCHPAGGHRSDVCHQLRRLRQHYLLAAHRHLLLSPQRLQFYNLLIRLQVHFIQICISE